jgi:hypothetical protein
MDTNNDRLELKFEGNGIKPNAVKPSEIATLIDSFEKALLSVIKIDNPEIDTDTVLFSFEDIKHESIGLGFSLLKNDNIKPILIASYLSLTQGISNSDYSTLPNAAIKHLKTILKFTQKYKCNANFNHNGKTLGTITSNTYIKSSKDNLLKGFITVFGELIDAGGDNPNIHLKIANEYSVTISADKQKVKELGTRLYEYIGLKGNAKWDAVSSKIIEFKLSEVLDYVSGNSKESINELREITSGAWDKYNTIEEVNSKLLRY